MKQSDQDKENKSMKEVFGEAMRYFGPGMIAAMGTRDPNEIYKAYIQGMTQRRADKQLELNRQQQIESSRTMQLSQLRPSYDMGFVDKSTGNVVKMDKRSGAVFSLDGSQVDPKNVEHEETYRQRNSINVRKEGLDVQKGRLNLDTSKAGQLSDAQVKQTAQSREILQSINEIEMLKEGVNTGPIAGRWNSFLATFGVAPEGFNETKVMTQAVKANFIRSLSGTAVSNFERKDLSTIVPLMTDDDETFEAKLVQFRKLVQIGGEEFLNAIATGQPLRQDLAVQLHQSLDKSIVAASKKRTDSSFEERLDKIIKSKALQNMQQR